MAQKTLQARILRLHDSLSSWLSSLPNSFQNNWRPLLALLLLSCTGCATQCCHLPDDFAHAFNQTQLGWEIQDVCNNCPLDACVCGEGSVCGCGGEVDGCCGVHVYDDAVWLDEPRPAQRPRIVVGPPPEPYEPPMPPKFLPVPVNSVF